MKSRVCMPLALALALMVPAGAQTPLPEQAPESQAQPVPLPPDAQAPSATSEPVQNAPAKKDAEKKPGRIRRALNRAKPNCVKWVTESCWGSDQTDAEASEKETTEQAKQTSPPPRSDRPAGVSSSKDTQVDLSPPANDERGREGANLPDSGVTEMKPWDPHKAAKNIEVGEYYLKRGNYRGAESRFREALHWKENDAIATYRLAETLDKMGRSDEALKMYESYLKILPGGELSDGAKKAIDRLTKTRAGISR